jgi:cytochrome c oxidase subunit 3
VGSFAGGALVLGIILWAHYGSRAIFFIGLAGILATMFFWWRDVVKESRTPGLHTPIVRIGLRYGMTLFIASEVMFFVAFFWAYFHFALFPEHVSGAEVAVWPPKGTLTFDPFDLPFLNTMILLLSGCTVTWAHHALLNNDRKGLIRGLTLTVLLGVIFTALQAWEYTLAPFKFYNGGIYSSTFFLATGFHGFHVIVGTTFLFVCLMRALKGHFTPEKHFGFEAAAWYWHFVDVVWLFLFVCIYWWGVGEIAHH